MKLKELMSWQWRDYHQFHQSKVNLIIHVITTPIFILACLAMVFFALQLKWLAALGSLFLVFVAIGLQGFGHNKEENAPIPFDSASQAVKRILLEQFVSFPKYIWTGGVAKAMKKKQ